MQGGKKRNTVFKTFSSTAQDTYHLKALFTIVHAQRVAGQARLLRHQALLPAGRH